MSVRFRPRGLQNSCTTVFFLYDCEMKKGQVNHSGLRTWIEVDRGAVAKNYKIFRGLISKKTKLMAVVKSNAYGHGLVDFSREAVNLGADFLGVDSIVEALALRREGITLPILVLGYTLPEKISEAAAQDISITVSTFETLRYIARNTKLPKPLKIHIKVDTGMHRQGFMLNDIKKVIKNFQFPTRPYRHGRISNFQTEGLYTHFASAKNPAFPKDTKDQLAQFRKWIAAFRDAGLQPIVHAAATAGAILFPDTHFDMVRIGIGLYGLWPAKETEAFAHNQISLYPALSWKTIVTEIKKLKKGDRVGYDFTDELRRDGAVGICPIGYWHGYPRALSSIGRVLVGGKEARVIGRVSMDMIAIDLTDIPRATVGDEVVLIGKSGAVSAPELGRLSDTSSYEIITRLNPLIKRIYL